MAELILTALGDDRTGLVSALADVVAEHGGNWQRSRMAELAGKFAGIVLIDIASGRVDALMADLAPLEANGLLGITVERADADLAPASGARRASVELIGPDRPGIVAELSSGLAAKSVSIEELSTDTVDAAMSGGVLFTATATVELPDTLTVAELQDLLEELGNSLMVDIDLEA